MKKIYTLLLASMLSISAFAQTYWLQNDTTWGYRTDLNYSLLNYIPDQSWKGLDGDSTITYLQNSWVVGANDDVWHLEASFYYDLQQNVTLNAFKFYGSSGYPYGAIANFQLYYSNNPTNGWALALTQTMLATYIMDWYVFNFTPQTGRYWKLTATPLDKAFDIYEIAFGSAYAPCSTTQPHVNDTILCGGGVTTLTATGGTNYIWYDVPTGGTQIASGATYTTPFLMGTTTYYVSNWNGICESTRDTVIVIVNLLPSVTINPIAGFLNINASSVNLSGTPTGGLYSGTGVSGNEFNPSVAGLGLKHITYSYTDTIGCSNSANESIIVYDTTGIICSDTIHISVTDTLIINAVLTGINPPNNINTLKIYPNPANTHIYIYCGNYSLMNGYTIRIDNSLAQTVFTTPVSQQQYYVDLSGWTGNGVYFVYIIDNLSNINDVRKIILQ